MTTMQEFLEERGGSFTQEDVAFLAGLGLRALLSDPILHPGSPMPAMAPPEMVPHQEDQPPPQMQQPQPSIRTESRSLFSVIDIQTIRPFPSDATLTGINDLMARLISLSLNGHSPRTAVAGSRVGEELIATCAGLGQTGTNVHPIIDAMLGTEILRVYETNFIGCPLTNNCAPPVVLPLDTFEAMDPQEFEVLVLCNPESTSQVESFMKHILPTGVLVLVGNNDLAKQMFADVGEKSPLGEVTHISMANWNKWKQQVVAEATKKNVVENVSASAASDE